MRLKNKTAIITGGGRGFGKATALAFAKEGANVVLASPDTAEIEEIAAQIKSCGSSALAITTDVSKKADVDAMAQAAYEKFGAVDILVNNAGVAVHSTLETIQEKDFDFVMGVNVKGVLFCTQAVFPKMCDQKSGHIINIASTAGKGGTAYFGTYTASKFAVMGLTEVTDSEGSQFGVKATAICPGAGATQQRAENHVDDINKLLQPDDVAELILFLVTQPARVFVGEVVIRPQFMKPVPERYNLKDKIKQIEQPKGNT